ncbi:MAG: RdgB/HAM1 family non-canonical purine NTP pyrophosphatase [Gammaproteobacteria bacterium]|nr:RdgB/HAM1 family non-canonical purine NTP pyrophosphatase [Gammaproteobacteria bacterium]NBT45039.1 RdgB/HAM1 family non-canonical purine NTP pyrophosphatase [Gammaproteobacteria bacterium]NBY24015.1 RdgB/HAM1 family non-canonical purine NTP pyrophosphatase [Gammaproteobacteria bacterium]NDE35040.1 RdgB/HAM1 family non-canonical purine NTP pyrophosphatase [Gammaproteobacteria bacterium]NDE57006.1 RdgB/HAM1 family non-canonical purine NTP pyrophosphatase [Gammaproteobacteria bacterium]
MKKVLVASNNSGKLREIEAILSAYGITAIPQSTYEIEDAEETGLTFVENALIKARHAATITGLPAIADDSGLSVDALDGAPGVFSARYAGVGAGTAAHNRKLLSSLQGVPMDQRTAHFSCVMVFLRHAFDPNPLIAEGKWSGRILEEASGEGGFGYDPLFEVAGLSVSAASLSADVKNLQSHRGQALRQLVDLMRADPFLGL